MRLLDNIGGVQTYFAHDERTGKNILKHVQDVEPIIANNAAAAESLNKKDDWWFVGTIPDSVVMQWSTECGAKPYSRGWRAYAAKRMNEAEYRKLNPNRIRLDARE